MIQIDDAGSGSLVGGTLIGIIRVEDLDYYKEIIPLNYYNLPQFQEKKYTESSVEIIKRGLKYLNVKIDEPIYICQGYMFDKARVYLKKQGYSVTSTRISEPLQSIIEEDFLDYIIGLGMPMDYLEYTKYPFHFHKLLKWVFSERDTRENLCKTGWKSWQKYKDIPLQTYRDYLVTGSYRCLKCGNNINTPCNIGVIKFTTNKDYFIYLHESCCSFQ